LYRCHLHGTEEKRMSSRRSWWINKGCV
jgi:hypothetical protein